MELDDFKKQINQKLETSHLPLSEVDIASLLNNKTQSIYKKIKKSLWFEIFSSFLIILTFGYIGNGSVSQSIHIYFTVFTFIFVLFIFAFAYLLKKTNQVNTSNLPVKAKMQNLVQLMEDFMKRYFQFTMTFIVICFVFSFALGYSEKEPLPLLGMWLINLDANRELAIGFSIGYSIALTIFVFYFTKWYLKKLYGNYVSELKNHLEELKSND